MCLPFSFSWAHPRNSRFKSNIKDGCLHIESSVAQSVPWNFVEGGSFSAELIVLLSLDYMQEVADIAEWEDEQIEYIEDKVSEEGKQEDLKKGKEPAQVL